VLVAKRFSSFPLPTDTILAKGNEFWLGPISNRGVTRESAQVYGADHTQNVYRRAFSRPRTFWPRPRDNFGRLGAYSPYQITFKAN
jgi:hypothetical protein